MLLSRHHNRQKGFSLAASLLIITVIGAVLTGVVYTGGGQQLRREAEISAWEGVKVAQAAHLYVRNLYKTETPPVGISHQEHIATEFANNGSISNITIQDLIDANYLPENFARHDGSGRYYNTLGQEIRVVLDNYPVGGAVDNSNTVPTAYVYFVANPAVDPQINTEITQGIKAQNVSISAPIYSGGNNIIGSCNTSNPVNSGGEAVVIWDSGCLDDTEFSTLTGEPYQQGSLIIPAWRTINFDSRAVLRFPVPERPDAQTMLTNLNLGECVDATSDFIDLVGVTDYLPDEDRLCNPRDDAGGIDNRRTIYNIGNIDVTNLIVDAQSGDDIVSGAYAENSDGLSDGGTDLNVTGNVTVSGDAKVFEGTTNVSTLNVDRNIAVSRADGTDSQATIGSLNTGQLNTQEVTFENGLSTSGDIRVSTSITDAETLTVGGNLTTRSLSSNAANARIDVMDRTIISNGDDAVSIQGDFNTENVAASGLNLRNATVNSSVMVGGDTTLNGVTNNNRIDVSNGNNNARCIGDCPRFERAAQCQNLAAQGLQTYDACMAE